jgi:hypothetical protein
MSRIPNAIFLEEQSGVRECYVLIDFHRILNLPNFPLTNALVLGYRMQEHRTFVEEILQQANVML